jgi:serine protease Do
MKNIKWLWPVFTSFLIVGGSAFGFVYMQKHFSSFEVSAKSTLGTEIKEKTKKLSTDLKTLIRENQRKVVQIEVAKSEGTGIGSGFLYNNQGDIITNAHVVEGASKVTVKTSDTKTFEGTVIGIGDTIDIAVVRVPGLVNEEPIKISSVKAELTDPVIALGSPLGYQNTATLGTISGTNRDLSDIDTIYKYTDMYQISAPITNGNSGGPLLHQKTGEVLAINSAGYDKGNVAFSIPIINVIEMVKNWSAHPQEIKGTVAINTGTNSTQLSANSIEEEAGYIVNYFYENLDYQDYVMAYSLLGSNWQKNTDYESFRSGYLKTLDVNVTDYYSSYSEESKKATVTIVIEAEERSENGLQISVYQATYEVGFENDTLKILSGKAKKL